MKIKKNPFEYMKLLNETLILQRCNNKFKNMEIKKKKEKELNQVDERSKDIKK